MGYINTHHKRLYQTCIFILTLLVNKSHQEVHRSIHSELRDIQRYVVIAAVVPVAACERLCVQLARIVIVLNKYSRFLLVHSIAFHNPVYSPVEVGMKKYSKFVRMLLENIKATTAHNHAALLVSNLAHGSCLGIEELTARDLPLHNTVGMYINESLIET